LGDSTPYGRSGVENLGKALAARGLKAVFEGSCDVGQTNMKAVLTQARESGAEAILAWGIGPELAVLAKDRASMGWRVPILGGWTLSLDNFILSAGAAGEGALMTQTFIDEPITSRRTGFLLAYRDAARLQKGQKIPSVVSAAQGYDSMLMLFAALRQANSVDGKAVRDALENLKAIVPGVVVSYKRPFSHTDHEAINENMVVTGVVRNGRVAFAHEEEVKIIIMGRREGLALGAPQVHN
jgi:branched-chain amino acid transport system substrate-binding protein